MTDSQDFLLRRATVRDAAHIVKQRRAMFEAMGYTDTAALDAMDTAFELWLKERLESDSYLGWLAEAEAGYVVAGAGLIMLDWPPGPTDSGSRRGYVLNVYTEPAFRGHGLARRLMETILDHCRADGIRIVALHASDAGRPIYESLGFVSTNEMRLSLE